MSIPYYSFQMPVDYTQVRKVFVKNFEKIKKEDFNGFEKDIDVTYLISGPEPGRTQFFNDCIKESKKNNYTAVIVAGLPGKEERIMNGKTEIVNHLPDDELVKILFRSEKIVCRSGYSTIMDLYFLGLKAEFIPTPGQTEQEYLAEWNNR